MRPGLSSPSGGCICFSVPRSPVYGPETSGPGGVGEQFALLNSSSLLYTTGGANAGSFPGGGSGAGYSPGQEGADGFLLLHW
ncbi:MAG: hypothetical protein LH609_20010 [Rudanella sp.]|nr:hypothetical protein [Rudanella sp.]